MKVHDGTCTERNHDNLVRQTLLTESDVCVDTVPWY